MDRNTKRKGMAVNEMKNKVMKVRRIGDQVGNLHIMCSNVELEQTTGFEYVYRSSEWEV
jgi:hypothetical protein